MSSTGRGVTSLGPLPLVPSPEPFDLRAAKALRISAESVPGLAPIRLVSQLFGRPRSLGHCPCFDGAPPRRTVPSPIWLMRPAPNLLDGPRANLASPAPPAVVRGAAARPLDTAASPQYSRVRGVPASGVRAVPALQDPRHAPATDGTNCQPCSLLRKRGGPVSQGRLLIVVLWASQAPGSHGSQLERTSC
jgi:hypothetical protein